MKELHGRCLSFLVLILLHFFSYYDSFLFFFFFLFQISRSHVNNFTGTVYQSLLLSQKQHGRTLSMEESVQPNTSPAQWPGTLAEVKIQKIFCLFEE